MMCGTLSGSWLRWLSLVVLLKTPTQPFKKVLTLQIVSFGHAETCYVFSPDVRRKWCPLKPPKTPPTCTVASNTASKNNGPYSLDKILMFTCVSDPATCVRSMPPHYQTDLIRYIPRSHGCTHMIHHC
jgi:hypothetical protein